MRIKISVTAPYSTIISTLVSVHYTLLNSVLNTNLITFSKSSLDQTVTDYVKQQDLSDNSRRVTWVSTDEWCSWVDMPFQGWWGGPGASRTILRSGDRDISLPKKGQSLEKCSWIRDSLTHVWLSHFSPSFNLGRSFPSLPLPTHSQRFVLTFVVIAVRHKKQLDLLKYVFSFYLLKYKAFCYQNFKDQGKLNYCAGLQLGAGNHIQVSVCSQDI